jgi:NAD(P)H-dependent FMN reductase
MTEATQAPTATLEGILNVNKEPGWTSHDVVAKVRRSLGGVRVGHAGTLDPAAVGVLPLLVGKATRIAEYLLDWDKEYLAVLRLGETTDTQDATGTVLTVRSTEQVTEQAELAIVTADAVVFVTPEYNRGYPSSLKFAIDSAREEWAAKPVCFVSYGGMSGGLRSVEQLRLVCAELHMVSLRDCVSLHMCHDLFDEAGALKEPSGPNTAARTMLDHLLWWAVALKEARARWPYGSRGGQHSLVEADQQVA